MVPHVIFLSANEEISRRERERVVFGIEAEWREMEIEANSQAGKAQSPNKPSLKENVQAFIRSANQLARIRFRHNAG